MCVCVFVYMLQSKHKMSQFKKKYGHFSWCSQLQKACLGVGIKLCLGLGWGWG